MPVPAGPAPDPSGSAGGKERGWVSEVYVRNPPPLGPLGGVGELGTLPGALCPGIWEAELWERRGSASWLVSPPPKRE